MSDVLRERVLKAMHELHYQPNALARSLRSKRSHTIGMLLPDSSNPYFAEIARSIEDTSFSKGYSVVLCNTDDNLDREQFYTNLLTEKQVDGIILVAAGESSKHIQDLQDRHFPLVVVDRDSPGVTVDSVQIDNEHGSWLATTHLIGLGHRRIACIASPSAITPSGERVAGYRRALRENGIDYDEDLVIKGDFKPDSGYHATGQMLHMAKPPTAIFACNDLMAIGAISAATNGGRRVPQDLSIVGFDDIQLAKFTNPSLTTIAQPKQEMGQLATKLLIERIRNPKIHPHSVILESHLVVRNSTSAPGRPG